MRIDRQLVFTGVAIGLGVFAAGIVLGVIVPGGGSGVPAPVPTSGPFTGLELPDPDTLPPPEDHGSYRVYPWGAPVDPNDFPATAAPGALHADYVSEEEARAFDMFLEPSYLPGGYELTEVQGVALGDREVSVSLYYEGEEAPLTVGRLRIEPGRKIVVQRASEATGRILELTTIKGLPAIVAHHPGLGSTSAGGVTLKVVDGDFEILVTGRAVTVDEARRVAESLIR